MIILGVESTCDETSVGIVKDGKEVLANVVASSSVMHEKYGGVVPEVAAREQVRCIIPTIEQALDDATKISNLQLLISNIDAVAVAYGPGLIGSLLIGVETAKTLALAWDKPLIAVNHLDGHLAANWLKDEGVSRDSNHDPQFPAIGLVVSGGHTDLIHMKNYKVREHLGGTRDDAAGEVFDKVARILGLPYPGGPEIERAAKNFKSRSFPSRNQISNFRLPRPMIGEGLDFSFSGLKTAVANAIQTDKFQSREEAAWEFQEAIVDVLVAKTLRAVGKFSVKSVVVGGGVAANNRLKEKLNDKLSGVRLFFPGRGLAIDNGAMIAAAAFFHKKNINPLRLSADPGLYFS